MTCSSEVKPDDPARPGSGRWAWLRAPWRRPCPPAPPDPGSPRLLFLDDDPVRASAFLKDHPRAVWVTTVPQCIERLAEPWDEVHLDHDLGGKRFVDSGDVDCGMEVTRWLCKEPRPHLQAARFFVHTHNSTAGLLMVLLMHRRGYQAEFRPFGLDLERLLAHNEPGQETADGAPADAGSASEPGAVTPATPVPEIPAATPSPRPVVARPDRLSGWRSWVARLVGQLGAR